MASWPLKTIFLRMAQWWMGPCCSMSLLKKMWRVEFQLLRCTHNTEVSLKSQYPISTADMCHISVFKGHIHGSVARWAMHLRPSVSGSWNETQLYLEASGLWIPNGKFLQHKNLAESNVFPFPAWEVCVCVCVCVLPTAAHPGRAACPD